MKTGILAYKMNRYLKKNRYSMSTMQYLWNSGLKLKLHVVSLISVATTKDPK